jgi:hypothetical protein
VSVIVWFSGCERMSARCGRVSSCSSRASAECRRLSSRCGSASSGCETMSLGFERVPPCSLISFLCTRRVLECEEELDCESSPELE